MSALTPQEIHRLVNDYIGVEAGYLNGFSYSKHQEFYPYYCGLDIDPLKLEGMTTKQRFIHILQNASPAGFALLRQHHPRLQPIGPRADDVTKILRALAQIIDVLNPMRNQASLAHPNPQLLGEDEAWLVINAARSFMHYVSRRLS